MSRPTWLSGPVAGIPPSLQPVAHALIEVQIDAGHVLDAASASELHVRPHGAASVAFHIRHLLGSVDRLLTYARGEALSAEQLATLEAEKSAGEPTAAELRALLDETMGRALAQLRATAEASLDEPREVGRGRLPSTVRGLLFHAAEHGARHCGQAITTLKVVQGGQRPAEEPENRILKS